MGAGLRASGLAREEVWITSKVAFFPAGQDSATRSVWMYDECNTKDVDGGGGGIDASIDMCLAQLGVSQVDLLLVHNPCVSTVEYASATMPHFFELMTRGGDARAIKPQTLPDGEEVRDLVLGCRRDRVTRAHIKAEDMACAKEKRAAVWRCMERALEAGKCRYIGVSNYPVQLLEEMNDYAKILPR